MALPKNKFSLSQEMELFRVGKTEIIELYGSPVSQKTEEWIYILQRSKYGIFSKKLHLYFISGMVINYSVHRYFMGVCIL
jgi:hypothetical protein